MLQFVRRIARRSAVRKVASCTLAVVAAHLVMAPVEYVKVCSLYGAGFYYIPGTDTCLKVGGWVQGGYGWGQSNFATTPDFNVNGSSGVVGFGTNALFGISGSNFSVGPGVGVYFGDMGGSTANPVASPGSTYIAKTPFIATYDFVAHMRVDQAWGLQASIGAADVKTTVSGTGAGFSASDSNTTWGYAIGAGVRYALPNSQIEITADYKYINVGSRNFNIPGTVPIDRNIILFLVGGQYNFNVGK